ncbi:uncharacterized protein K452DRAFT_292356 [Aplosporella prunicola CBS 121167]|uniref:Uncharacterized protein n=1 Tax=Aplosporella prunicola CBS 121167 TaxID=1176127 RepID=A0A6A6B0E4_9PEZI|nr:uncharacterized protein K452DRAFT_292356 [Aplosporella prunicola CBS 121167]KAF2136507.1 hypothetical protein K452DRAFT_292356 [Aplosporella prunicola CBS 121167]
MAIAKQIRRDAKLCESDTGRPSLLAFRLPRASSRQALAIATHLVPSPDMSPEIKRLVYNSLLERIRNHEILARREPIWTDEELGWTNSYEDARELILDGSELEAAAMVLHHLTTWSDITPESTVADAIKEIERRLKASTKEPSNSKPDHLHGMPEPKTTSTLRAAIPRGYTIRKRLCYICRCKFTVPHSTYLALCEPCGTFNLANSNISLPNALDLTGKTALVTGGRVNLGYHTALRLLRCGAKVIVSSRYPRDTSTRYACEADSSAWKNRLKIVGADFRSAKDAFQLVAHVKAFLEGWGESRLYVLVNNAAQTLTDPISKEQSAIQRENLLEGDTSASPFMVEHTYQARVRGGITLALDSKTETPLLKDTVTKPSSGIIEAPENSLGHCIPKSSWTQSLQEIPYEDVISAHSVNTFVPLILCRELITSMGSTQGTPSESIPQGYIVNVSSREGIFEGKPDYKSPHHVHTNMSKAALNMITETEAASAWRKRRVAMTTVDPGYMSAAPEFEDMYDGKRPIGWEDGAARVLWPVAVGEREGRAVWGRFLKHFGAVEVDPGAGR